MKTRRVILASLLLPFAAQPAFSGQKIVAARQAAQDIAECCAPPAALLEVESKIGELANVAGECPSAEEAGLARAKKDFAELFPEDAEKTEADVHGIKLAGTAEQLEFAKKIVGGEGISNGDRLPSAWPSIAKGCAEVVCALTKLLGSEESALRSLNVAKRAGYFITASQFVNPAGVEQIWRAAEIRTIDEVIQKAPENFRRLSTMRYFYRVHDDYRNAENPNTAAQAVAGWGSGGGRIEVYAGAFSDEGFAAPTILHELAHHLDFNGLKGAEQNQSTGFSKLSGWDGGKRKQTGTDKAGNPTYETVYTPSRTDNFITDYARSSPLEDWADTAAYYAYAPELLKAVAPEKYALMKEKVFGGREYLDERWPALERAVGDAGGEPALLQACLERLTALAPGDEASVREVMKEEGGYVMWRGRPVEQFALRTQCLKKKADRIAATLKTDPSFCERGGMPAIEDALRKKIMWPLRSILAASLDAAKESAKTSAQRCFEKKDFTRACAIGKDAIKAALLANAEFLALPETTRNQVGARILNLITPVDTVEPIVKAFTPGRTLQACLVGVDAIGVGKDGIRYRTVTVQKSGNTTSTLTEEVSVLMLAKGCLGGLRSGWRAEGFTFDSDAGDLGGWVAGGKTINSLRGAFEKEVLSVWSVKLQACPDPAARQPCMEGVIKAWAEKHKLGPAFDVAALTGRLLKTVKVE